MGQIADDIINGLLCQECGQFIDFEEPGFPRTCEDCDPKNGCKLKRNPPPNSGWVEE
jgi:Fe2+ or Zn2+ uptake regulation protein